VPPVKLFRQVRTIGVEAIYVALLALIGIAVLGYIVNKTAVFPQLEAFPGVGFLARGGKALVNQTYNP